MKQHRQHSKRQDEKKVPSTAELRRATWSSIEQIVALLMKLMFEILLGRAATEQIGALPYERTGNRKIYRNGHYRRSLGTRFGRIENLLIPRFREGALMHSLFAPYQQRTDDVDKALVSGASTNPQV